MHVQTIQILPYACALFSLLCGVTLFVSLKRELARKLAAHNARIDQLLIQFHDSRRAEPPPEPVYEAAAPLPSGLNQNRRIVASRLLRRGEDVSHVAAAAGMPRAEIELLARVQTITTLNRASKAHEIARPLTAPS